MAMTKTRATAIGFTAILLWALLALFTVGSAPVPPLQLNAMCFAVGGTLGLIWTVATGQLKTLTRIPLPALALGTIGLFGYHALYFAALRNAPPAQAGLIAYLWPLLIVLFSGLLPGETLRAGHLIGALAGFFGAALIIGGVSGLSADHLTGYALALACALTWSGYSVLSRRFGAVPTSAVTIFCLLTAALSALLHLALEDTVAPNGTIGWLSILALGLGPVGLAFYTWDIGVKRGDIQILGVASYAAPLLSTLVLVATGIAEPTARLAMATLLITGGAALAARASLRKR
ncbi:EamA domain-containing membrane protein RarD [Pseudooceanicola nitratireducens]|jgi:drug/metabolite transporter (DMT)-like permease|uniref:EamA domain-containing membrane protein RarD n=2 Tax=Pseudooceanicola nitratireducens TaxID=517719 RepID=A0A1I1IL14_9RHOB|nr:EamA domain-containing membrane protein RarD [Pseudooceanicola nitratireducens]SFC36926.1 EamA domain-containing membrane protein RarD [Pseudooceanicola nitratireducens]